MCIVYWYRAKMVCIAIEMNFVYMDTQNIISKNICKLLQENNGRIYKPCQLVDRLKYNAYTTCRDRACTNFCNSTIKINNSKLHMYDCK